MGKKFDRLSRHYSAVVIVVVCQSILWVFLHVQFCSLRRIDASIRVIQNLQNCGEKLDMSYTRTEENCGLDFSLWVAKPRIGKNKFPTSGLAGVVKTNSPQAAQPRVEEFVFTTTAKPRVEKFNRPHFSSVRV